MTSAQRLAPLLDACAGILPPRRDCGGRDLGGAFMRRPRERHAGIKRTERQQYRGRDVDEEARAEQPSAPIICEKFEGEIRLECRQSAEDARRQNVRNSADPLKRSSTRTITAPMRSRGNC